jgi:hypothetical protein
LKIIPTYKVHLFWTDKLPVENANGTFAESQLAYFLANKIEEQLNMLPQEMREQVFYKLIANI